MPEPSNSQITNPWIRKQTTTRSSFSPTEEVRKLLATQKSNQKIVLSFYGYKIDMPFKLTGTSGAINITTYLADVPAEFQVIDSYKVEITHPLGVTHFRIDVPKGKVASQMTGDAYAIAELNIRAKREFEDYLINRKQYDLEFSTMDLSHREARLNRKYEYVTRGIDLALGVATLGVVGTKAVTTGASLLKASMAKAKENYTRDLKQYEWLTRHGLSFGMADKAPRKKMFAPIAYKNKETMMMMGLGAYKGTSGMASGIAGLVSASERASLQEEGFAIQIREKALQSYTIDLGFERQKEDQLFTMRRLFANQTYNDVTDRERQKALDKYESPQIKDEIYLELWTTSGLQDNYVTDYHNKYGVDCRVVLNQFDNPLKIHDEIRAGIYCIEDVVIENLADRVELEFLKARLTGGIKFIPWVEHERVKELTPIDKRILELQSELAEVKHDRQEKEQICQETITRISKNNDELNHQLAEQRVNYHQLSESYREKEAELSTQTNLAALYKNEADHFKQDLLKESSQHAREKEEHSGTKEDLEQKKGEIASLTRQVDSQTQQIQQLTREKGEAQQQLAGVRKEKEEQQTKIQQLEQEVQSNKDKEQRIQELTQENQRLQTELRERPTEKEEILCPDIWRKSLFKKVHVEQDYLVVSCNSNFDVVKFDESVYAWVKTDEVTLKAFDQYKLVRPIFDPKQVPMRAKKYNNNLGSGEGNFKRVLKTKEELNKAFFVPDSRTKKVYDWSTTIKIANEFNEPFPYFLVKPTRAEDTLACPYNSITNYGEYLEALGMELVEGQVVTKQGESIRALNKRVSELEKEKQEQQASLSGLHEIVNAKDQQIRKLEAEKGNLYLEWLGKTVKAIDPQAKFVIKKNSDYEIIQLSKVIKAFTPMPSKQEGVRNRIWTYPSYELFTVGGENGSNILRRKGSVWDGWISYFNEVQTTYQQLITRKVINFGNISQLQILFHAREYVIPYFKVTQYTMTSGDNAGSKRYISLENGPIFWDSKQKLFSHIAFNDSERYSLQKISNFKEYKELFGMTVDLRKGQVIDFETEEDYTHWKETEGDGAQEKDVTSEYL